MIDLISALVANGTTAWNWGYEPWLPFYSFFPVILLVSLFIMASLAWLTELSATRVILWGAVFFTSSISAVIVVFFLWLKLDLTPIEVSFWWALNAVLIWIGQWYYIRKSERVKKRIEVMEEREKL